MSIKPKRVDSVGLFHELYEDLRFHPIGMVISVIASAFLGIITSGYFCISCNNLISAISSSSRTILVSFSNIIDYGLFKWWGLSIILWILFLFLSFKIYRSIRKTYSKNYDDNYLKSKNKTFGGAHFQTREEIEKNCNIYKQIEETTQDILGIYDNQLLTLKKFGFSEGANRNYIYFGPPGIGKTSVVVKGDIYQGIRRGESLVVVDSKGAVYNETSAVARKFGYKVRILNLKPNELKNSDGFDLFASLNPLDESLDAQVAVITTIILQNSQSNPKSDYQPGNYWYDSDEAILKTVILMHATDPKFIKRKKNNLAGVYEYIAAANHSSFVRDLQCYEPGSSIREAASSIESINEERIKGQVFSGIKNRLGKLGNPYIKRILSNNEIDTTLPMKEKCIYYVVISDQENTYRFLSTLFFTQMFIDMCNYSDTLSNAEKKKQLSVHYILDECKSTGGIYGLEDKISNVRSRNIALTLIFQNTTQLNMMYGENGAETIKECCYLKALLGGGGTKTTKEFEEMLGNETIVTESYRYMESAADVLHAHGKMQKTITENERPLMYASSMNNGDMKPDEIIYVINGMPPLRLEKYFTEKAGTPIHPMEALGIQLGRKNTSRHKPKWRYLEEQAAKENSSSVFTSDNNENNISRNVIDTSETASPAENVFTTSNESDTFGYTEE